MNDSDIGKALLLMIFLIVIIALVVLGVHFVTKEMEDQGGDRYYDRPGVSSSFGAGSINRLTTCGSQHLF